MFSVTVILHVDTGHRDEFLEAARKQAANSRNRESGCLDFQVYESEEDPSCFFFHERYADKAAFEQVHTRTDYFAHYQETVRDWVISRDLRVWNRLES